MSDKGSLLTARRLAREDGKAVGVLTKMDVIAHLSGKS